MTTVIFKPTDGCNARCLYCSAAHPGAAKRVSSTVLREAFRLFGDWAARFGRGRLAFIWHGGEPLLMPASFWDEVLEAQAEILAPRGVAVENRIQSNLTLLTEERLPALARLLGGRGVVGTSADPLPGIRELKGARDGLYEERWAEAVRLLRSAGIRHGILYVVHRRSLPDLARTYRSFRERHPGAGLRFNPLYREGRAEEEGVWAELGITAEEWGEALIALYEEWVRDGRPGDVQPFGPWWRWHAEGRWGLSCECSGRCAEGHFGVDPDGGVYLCGRSSDAGAFRYGTAGELTADDLRRHPARRALRNRLAYLRRTHCRDCAYWTYCHGGCPNDAVLSHGTPFAPTSVCAGLKRFFEHAFPEPRRESPRAAPGAGEDLAAPAPESEAPRGVAAIERLEPEEAERLADRFLHDPEVTRPIEPFASLLAAFVERRKISLWDLLAPAGDRGRASGQAPAGAFLSALPREHPECLECGSFFACEGRAAWTGGCAPWKAVLEKLAAAARELRELAAAARRIAS